jgi:hypothetical protein
LEGIEESWEKCAAFSVKINYIKEKRIRRTYFGSVLL